MNESIFEYYEPLYRDTYTLEAWILWLSLWIQYIGYYVCLYGGFLLLIVMIILPIMSLTGLAGSIKIKLGDKKHKKHKEKQKFEEKMRDNYINKLENITKKKKKHKNVNK